MTIKAPAASPMRESKDGVKASKKRTIYTYDFLVSLRLAPAHQVNVTHVTRPNTTAETSSKRKLFTDQERKELSRARMGDGLPSLLGGAGDPPEPANLPALLSAGFAQQEALVCFVSLAAHGVEFRPPPLNLCVLEETDSHRISQREKQVSLGKSTAGYRNYRRLMAKEKRGENDPQTPKASQYCSKRDFWRQLKEWRQQLHVYDEMKFSNCDAAEEDMTEEIIVWRTTRA